MLQSHLDADLCHQTGCGENEFRSPFYCLFYTFLNSFLCITGLISFAFHQALKLLHNVISSQLVGIGPCGILHSSLVQKGYLQGMLAVIQLSGLEQVHKAADFLYFFRILHQYHISCRLSIFIPKPFDVFFDFFRTAV